MKYEIYKQTTKVEVTEIEAEDIEAVKVAFKKLIPDDYSEIEETEQYTIFEDRADKQIDVSYLIQ